jgi:hypothetical protein
MSGNSGGGNSGKGSNSPGGNGGGRGSGVAGGELGGGSGGGNSKGRSNNGGQQSLGAPAPTSAPATTNPSGTTNPPATATAPTASPRATPNAPVPTNVPTNATPTLTSLDLRDSGAELALPSALIPGPAGSGSAAGSPQLGIRPNLTSFGEPLVPRAGTPVQIVQTCRTSIITAALPYGVVRVDAASGGRASRMQGGGLTAPIEVRAVYARANLRQIRQSRITCQLNADGAVVALRQ